MAGPFVSTPLTTGLYLTQARQQQMNTNALYNRSRGDFVEVPYEDFTTVTTVTFPNPGTPNVTFSVKVDGTEKASTTVTSGNGTIKLLGIDVSSFSAGLHYVEIVGGGVGKRQRFVKREDMDKLTVWADMITSVVYDSATGYTTTRQVVNISIISHREAQTW